MQHIPLLYGMCVQFLCLLQNDSACARCLLHAKHLYPAPCSAAFPLTLFQCSLCIIHLQCPSLLRLLQYCSCTNVLVQVDFEDVINWFVCFNTSSCLTVDSVYCSTCGICAPGIFLFHSFFPEVQVVIVWLLLATAL